MKEREFDLGLVEEAIDHYNDYKSDVIEEEAKGYEKSIEEAMKLANSIAKRIKINWMHDDKNASNKELKMVNDLIKKLKDIDKSIKPI